MAACATDKASVVDHREDCPPMSHRSVNRFNQREVSRAVRAVTDTGAAVDRIEVDPATGKIAVIVAKPGSAESVAGAKAWDDATTAIVKKSKNAPTRR